LNDVRQGHRASIGIGAFSSLNVLVDCCTQVCEHRPSKGNVSQTAILTTEQK